MVEDWQIGGFGLYVHWPFCESKCPYCDFNSHVVASVDQDRWKKALLSEVNRVASETQGRVLKSIYFGGGTPSLMQADVVAAILDRASDVWSFSNSIEITLEANPSSVEIERLRGFRSAGVNRVSMGIQALNDHDLKLLGRLHSVEDARRALKTATSVFDRVSFDLIYARQDQSLNEWETELEEALSYGTDHMSLYQLTVEQGTAFGDRFNRGSLRGLPSEDLSADMFFATQEITAAAGLPAYETSNHAASGQESVHNRIYWQCGDYAGIGPGAHGRLTLNGQRYETETYLTPGKWLEAVETQKNGESKRTLLDTDEKESELLLMGLRLYDGIEIDRIVKTEILNNINDLCDIGLLEIAGERVKLTLKGRPLLNSILQELV